MYDMIGVEMIVCEIAEREWGALVVATSFENMCVRFTHDLKCRGFGIGVIDKAHRLKHLRAKNDEGIQGDVYTIENLTKTHIPLHRL